MKNTRFSK